MSQVTDSILFRQKLYENFRESGLLNKLKTSLRANLLEKLQKPTAPIPSSPQEDTTLPFHLRHKFLESVIAEHLQLASKEYSLSILMAECGLEQEDCLRYVELSQIVNLGKPAEEKSFLFRLLEEFARIRCGEARERSTQTDFESPLSSKLQAIEKDYKPKLDYWKLVPGPAKTESALQAEQKIRSRIEQEKGRMRRELQLSIKQQTEKKYENQYLFRMKEVQKQHETRITELRNREKAVLEGLERKKKELDEKSRDISEKELKMINHYELRQRELEAEYRARLRDLEAKEKEFWKKQLELKAKKREYEDTIRLVKQKVIAQSTE